MVIQSQRIGWLITEPERRVDSELYRQQSQLRGIEAERTCLRASSKPSRSGATSSWRHGSRWTQRNMQFRLLRCRRSHCPRKLSLADVSWDRCLLAGVFRMKLRATEAMH